MVPIDADKLKSLIQERLDYGDCAEYVAKLIQKAASIPVDEYGHYEPVESTDVMTLFEKIRSQPAGGILFDKNSVPNHPEISPVAGGGGWAWGSYSNGNAMINIYSLGYYRDRPAAAANIPYRYGIRGLHETIHKAGQHWGYNDDHLTRAARALEPDAKYKNWDGALASHCLPQQNR